MWLAITCTAVRKMAGPTPALTSSPVGGSTYTDANVPAGTYYYVAVSVDTYGNESSYSGCAHATVTGTSVVSISTPSPLPQGTVGSPYSQITLTATGGTPPYAWSVTAGALPGGLTLNSAGTISGTPSAAGAFNFTVQAQDSASNTASAVFGLTVASSLAIATPSPLPAGATGSAYSLALAATGGNPPYAWSVAAGSLPPGLTLSSTGTLSGSPTAAGTYSFTAQVLDAASSGASLAYSLTIGSGLSITTPSLPAGAIGSTYSQTLTAAGGTSPYAWSVTAGSLPAGITLGSAGALAGTPTAGGSFNFTAQVRDSASHTASAVFSLVIAGGSLQITTPSALPSGVVGGAYSETLAATGGTPPYTWSLIAAALPGSFTLNPAGTLAGTATAAGNFGLIAEVQDSASHIAYTSFSLTIVAGSLAISTSSTLPAGVAGTAYSQALAAYGGTPPYSWSLTAGTLPAGVTLSSTGSLSGTPSASGSFSFTAKVQDSASHTASAAFSLTINAAPLAISTSSTLPAGTAGAAYFRLSQPPVELRRIAGP